MLLNVATKENNELEKNKSKFIWQNWLVFFVLIFLVILFSLLSDRFMSSENIANIGRQTAMTSIIAFGMTFVITTGGIDLSVGAILGLSGLAVAGMMYSGMNYILASAVALSIGASVGIINGFLVANVRIPAFLVTLGTMSILRGIALTITGTKSVIITDQAFISFWGAGDIAGIPTSIIWTLLALIVCGWLYHFTSFGNYVKSVGGNETAAKYSGINTRKIMFLVFVISGILSAVAGMIMAARLKNGRPEVGAGMEMDAIAAVVLGGTVMSGGKGNILNTLIGSLIIGIVLNGLIILGLQQNVQLFIKGVIIIAAVATSEKNKL